MPIIHWPKAIKNTFDALKPADSAEREVIEMVQDRMEEANEFRIRGSSGTGRTDGRQSGLSLETQWEQAGNRYLGNHWSLPYGSNNLIEGFQTFINEDQTEGTKGIRRFTLNRTQTSIISNVSGMLRELPEITFQPVETDDHNEYMLSAMGGATVADLVDAAKMKRDALARIQAQAQQSMYNPEAPAGAGQVAQQQAAEVGELDEVELTLLEAEFTPGQLGRGPEGRQNPQGPTETITEVQAGAVETLIEQELLREEDLIEIDDRVTERVLSKVFRAVWDRSGCDHQILRNELYCSIFGHQPMRFQFDWQRGVFDLENTHVLNVWIDPTKDEVGKSDYLIFDYVIDLDEAKTRWPHLDEALDKAKKKGLVGDAKRFRLGAASRDTDFKRPMVRVRTAFLRHQKVDMTEAEALEAGGVERVSDLLEAGEGEAVGLEGFEFAARDDDGALQHTVPGDDNWPQTVGVREIKILPQIDRKVVDRRCPYWDIPFGWNVNVPIPYTPYGQGEPIRLEDIQAQINLILTILSNHIRYYQWPMRYWPKSIFAQLRNKGFSLHSRPGMEVPIDDRKYFAMMRGGRLSMTEEVPAIPAQYVQILQMYLAEHDRMSGDVEVRQGVAPSDRISGAAVDSLRTEAMGPLAFKSRFTEFMLERIAHLGVQAMVDYYPPREWQKICSRYPLEAMRRIIERCAHREWNIRVGVVTGRGVNETHRKEQAVNEHAQGLRSTRSTMEEIGVDDPDEEIERMNRERAEAAQAEASVQAASVDALGEVQPQPGAPA